MQQISKLTNFLWRMGTSLSRLLVFFGLGFLTLFGHAPYHQVWLALLAFSIFVAILFRTAGFESQQEENTVRKKNGQTKRSTTNFALNHETTDSIGEVRDYNHTHSALNKGGSLSGPIGFNFHSFGNVAKFVAQGRSHFLNDMCCVHPLLQTFLFAFGYFVGQLHWVGNAFLARGPEFIWVMPVGTVFLPAFLALLWIPLIAIFIKFRPQQSWGWPLYLASLITIAEFVRGHLFGGLPWGLLGTIWPAGGNVSQVAAIIGVYGLTFVMTYVCAAFGNMFASPIFRWRQASLSILLILLMVGYGGYRLASAERLLMPQDGPILKFRIVVPPISMKQKLDPTFSDTAMQMFVDLSTRDGLEEIDYLLWSENALPFWPPLPHNFEKLLALDSKLSGVELITGSLRLAFEKDGDDYKIYNSLIHIKFSDQLPHIQQFYDKIRLVPFGEVLPLEPFVKLLAFGLLDDTVSFAAGQFKSKFLLKGQKAAIQICYEDIFADFIPRDESRPDFIINVSNDSWFGTQLGPYQHANQTRYRAIEEGLGVVRAASGGFSGAIDPFGRAVVGIMPYDSGFIDLEAPKKLIPTMYGKHSKYSILFICVIIVLMGVYISVVPSNSRHIWLK